MSWWRDPGNRLLLAIALGKTALNGAFLARYDYFRDELYYLACARHLAWGYVDQPPLSIAILAPTRALFGDSQVSSPNALPIVSYGSGLLYTIGARANRWTLEALDWESGASAFHWVIGGQRFNSLFSGTAVDEDGRIHYGGPWGRIRLAPVAAP